MSPSGHPTLRATHTWPPHPEGHALLAIIQVDGVIRSYGVSNLLDEYERGSRLWLFDRLTAWLDSVIITPGQGAGAEGRADPSRLFPLLADPGMGKSIFSAVAATKLAVWENKQAQHVVLVSG